MNNEVTFEADDVKLSDVLFHNRRYRIPRYQRPYAWGEEQLSEFWEDLITSKEPYFLGSFIFNKEQEKETGYVDIIDGQQRLITITILIAVLRDIVKTLSPERAMLYQRQDIAIEDRGGKYSYRILPSDALKDFFMIYIQSGDVDIFTTTPEYQEQMRVKKNYEYLI